MRKNYVLIDFENVQPESLAMLQHEHFEVKLFLGANQSKVPFEIANAMQSMCGRAEYVKISGNGSNALDFHIAYYLGQLSVKEPHAYFHIISKDTGFDPLIDYMKTKGISVIRENTIEDIPLLKAPQPPASPKAPQPAAPVPPPPSPPLIVRPPVSSPVPKKVPDQRVNTVWEKVRPPKATKPRTVKTLTSHIKAMFPNAITETQVATIIAEMRSRKYIAITENKITYNV
jgi:hypothetical protein